MNESRRRVAQYVRTHPGSHFSAIVDALDQATGQVQHHLSRLVSDDRLERTSLHGQTHYYPPGYDDREQTILGLLHRETARAIVTRLLTEDGQRPDCLASDLGLARSTIEYHLDRLDTVDVVEKRRDSRGRVTVHLRHPHETARLLIVVETGSGGWCSDRFVLPADSRRGGPT